ncbi:MAG: septation protein SpoVG family protein [Candidatus Omnitrophica bacterium]|nr:septation protein SpoVG family protein [Candidatus Omnitrophota bacterium]
MEITEVRVFTRESADKKLRAFATITFDDSFVVRNIKIIEGNKGLFVAMPSRKMKESCPKCSFKNAIRSKFCNQCGSAMPPSAPPAPVEDKTQRQSEHRDIAHPITAECREMIQKKVLEAYEAESNAPSAEAAPSQPASGGGSFEPGDLY